MPFGERPSYQDVILPQDIGKDLNQAWRREQCSAEISIMPIIPLHFISDLAYILKSFGFLFADEVKFVCSADTEYLGSDKRPVPGWDGKNDIYFITGRSNLLFWSTESLTVSNDQGLYAVNAVKKEKDLGQTITSDLQWTNWCIATAQKSKGDLLKLNLGHPGINRWWSHSIRNHGMASSGIPPKLGILKNSGLETWHSCRA